MIHERFAERFEEWLGLIRDHHTVSGSTGTGRITPTTRARASWATPTPGIYCHPTIVDGVTADDEIYSTETFGPIVGVARFGDFDEAIELANGHGYGLSAAIYTNDAKSAFRFRERVSAGMVSVNNSTSGRRGPPAVRRQRQVGQRLAPVGDLGARPVHALAVHELGLRRQAAEGADGSCRADRRLGLPPGLGLTPGPERGHRPDF